MSEVTVMVAPFRSLLFRSSFSVSPIKWYYGSLIAFGYVRYSTIRVLCELRSIRVIETESNECARKTEMERSEDRIIAGMLCLYTKLCTRSNGMDGIMPIREYL